VNTRARVEQARDELVRAAVWAFPLDGSPEERSAAAARVVAVHRLVPLLELEDDLADVEAVLADTPARRELLARLYLAVDTLERAERAHQDEQREATLRLLRETADLFEPVVPCAA
jgi:hypothetical protein